MKRSLSALLWVSSLGVMLFVYQNCSGVKFNTSPEVLKQEAQALQSTSSITINGGAKYTREKDVQLGLESPRAVEMKISNKPDCSDGTWEPYLTAKAWSLSKTDDNVSVYAEFKNLRDQVTTCIDASIIHDDIPPRAAFDQAQNLITNKADLQVTWTASDNISGIDTSKCVKPDGTVVDCANLIALASVAEGTNTLSLKLTDKAGNVSDPFVYNFVSDRTPPVVTFFQKPAALTGSGSATFGINAVDAITGVDKVMCRMDPNAPYAACTSPVSYTGLVQNTYTFSVYAVDKAGNSSAPLTYTWSVDMTAPTIRFTKTPDPVTNTTNAMFAFDGTKNNQPITKFECHVDGAAFAACTSPVNLAGLTEGPHYFEFRGIDDLGNVSSPLRYDWLIDVTAPVVAITDGPAALVNSAQADLKWTVTDAGSGVKTVECRIDAAAYKTCDGGAISFAMLAEGKHTFDVRATDRAGNQGTASRAWTVDLTPPQVTITSAPAPFVSTAAVNFEFTATDLNGVALYECRVDNGAYGSCLSPYTAMNVLEGSHIFYVRATDKAGNVSLPASSAWTLDLSPPIIRIISAPVNITTADKALIQYQVVDLSSGVKTVKCGLMPAAPVDCTAAATVNLGLLTMGNYVFQIVATDNVGNSITEKVSFSVGATKVICDPFTPGSDATCNGGLVGNIYYLDSQGQTAFKGMANKTVDYFYSNGILVDALLNLNQLFVSTRSFTSGFPTNTGGLIKDNAGNTLNEYFAFKLKTVMKLDPLNDVPGWYQFATLSDDGSMVLLKAAGAADYTTTLIANDSDHSTRMGCSANAIYMDDTSRMDTMIKYYQGPRTEIALTMMWRKVATMTTALDATCGVSGNDAFFGPSPYTDFKTSGYGKLLTNGWRVMAPANFLAPPQ
jgi:hypothetical protein